MRIRLRFTKYGKVRFTSHRDVARMWERAWKKADFAVAYTEGFSPRPKMHFGLALSTGYESAGEYLDIDVPEDAPIDFVSIPEQLSAVLPVGMGVDAAAEVDRHDPSLQQAVTSCTWRIRVGGLSVPALDDATAAALAAGSLVTTRQRKGKDVTDDLRPYVHALSVIGPNADGVELEAELGTQPRSLRPSELLAALHPGAEELGVCRTHQWMSHDGARREPLPLGATSVPHAAARAS